MTDYDYSHIGIQKHVGDLTEAETPVFCTSQMDNAVQNTTELHISLMFSICFLTCFLKSVNLDKLLQFCKTNLK